jgi:hypothetical protein
MSCLGTVNGIPSFLAASPGFVGVLVGDGSRARPRWHADGLADLVRIQAGARYLDPRDRASPRKWNWQGAINGACSRPEQPSSRVVTMSVALPLKLLLVTLAGWVNRAQEDVIEYLKAERAVLLEQPGGRARRFTEAQRRRLAEKARPLGRACLTTIAAIVTPDTILRWCRRIAGGKYEGARQCGGRPRMKETVAEVLLRFARECPRAGYTRLRDMLATAGHEVARATVARLLKEHGIVPAPSEARGVAGVLSSRRTGRCSWEPRSS